MSQHFPDRVHAHHELAATFKDPGVVAAYQHRAPYPPQTFDILARLITDAPRAVLDIGAGQGSLARPLAARVDQVDALDVSEAMLAAGAQQPGGTRPNLRWILGAAETAELAGPYALVTAGASMHWMSLPQTMARLATVMTDHAVLAVIDRHYQDAPWVAQLADVITRHSRNPDYLADFSVAADLADQGLWQITGRATTSFIPFRQPVAAYIEHFHSTSSLARKWMPDEEAAEFDEAIERIVRPYAADGMLEQAVAADMVWGRPTPARPQPAG
jgi:ubiquinone/menaquinone biosynthesis C-methylase UbiE